MANNLDVGQESTSDELINPYCDPCFDSKQCKLKAYGYCKECVQFLCKDCYGVHGNLKASMKHCVYTGDEMPKSQDDKPQQFEHCDVHPKQRKDQFCCEHKCLICSACSLSEHKGCPVEDVENAWKMIESSEYNAFYEQVKSLQETLVSTLSSVDQEIRKKNEQKEIMLDEARKVYKVAISKVNLLFENTKTKIETDSQSQMSILSQQKTKVSDLITKIDLQLSYLRQQIEKPFDIKVFLSLQDIASYTNESIASLKDYRQPLQSLTFVPSEIFLDLPDTLGLITRSTSVSMVDEDILNPEITFPVSPFKQKSVNPEPAESADPKLEESVETSLSPLPLKYNLSNMKTTKQGTYKIKLIDDKYDSGVSGMAMTKDRKILMTDKMNYKVKLFSQALDFLSSISVPDKPWAIAVINDKEAAFTTKKKTLTVVDISGTQMRIKTTIPLEYYVRGMTSYIDKLIVTCPDRTPSVKLIDQTGRVYWSLSCDQQGYPLFNSPRNVSSHCSGRTSAVVVTDTGKDTLTLLNGDTGELIITREVKGKQPRGVTLDTVGNVYVCYQSSEEVAVFPGNLSKERVLLTRKNGLSGDPRDIFYDDATHQLVISYCYTNWMFKTIGYNDIEKFCLDV